MAQSKTDNYNYFQVFSHIQVFYRYKIYYVKHSNTFAATAVLIQRLSEKIGLFTEFQIDPQEGRAGRRVRFSSSKKKKKIISAGVVQFDTVNYCEEMVPVSIL